eukprot:1170799-Pleurochrysis_carterae.AAC.1
MSQGPSLLVQATLHALRTRRSRAPAHAISAEPAQRPIKVAHFPSIRANRHSETEALFCSPHPHPPASEQKAPVCAHARACLRASPVHVSRNLGTSNLIAPYVFVK